jgi:hypothetical protein
MGPNDRRCIRNNATVDSDFSVVFPIRQPKRDRRELERVPPRPPRRNRRIEPTSTKMWVRRLFAVSLIASLSKTDDGFASFCDAFVAPTSKSKVSMRSEQWRITKTENRKNKNRMTPTPISRHFDRNTGVTTSSLSTSPTSQNGMNGGANNNNNNNSSNNKDMEIAGLVLAVAIILSLAGMAGPSGGVSNSNEVTTASVAVMTKVVENTVPTTSTEVVAVTLGESIGGVIGAIFSVGINFLLRGGKSNDDSSKPSDSEDSNSKKSSNMSSLVSQGLSDGDYFIANSASTAFLESVGVPESVAKYSSVFIAAIPSQLVKIGSRISEQKRAKEEELLATLVRDEAQRKANRNPNALISLWKKNNKKKNKKVVNPKKFVPVAVAAATVGGAVSSSTTETTAAAAVTAIDFVEVFADVTRWLEYE